MSRPRTRCAGHARTLRRSGVTSFTVALLLGGCYQPDYTAKQCQNDRGCPAGYACVSQRCLPGDGGNQMTPPTRVEIAFAGSMAFMVGTNSDSVNGFDKPAFQIDVAPFFLDHSEVTTTEYRQCVRAGGCTPASSHEMFCNYGRTDHEDHPINCVSYHQATAFCDWIRRRLPTEFEWEFAARGLEGRIHPWGNDPPNATQLCWNRASTGTCKAGLFPPTSSLWDLAGNVWEWTSSPACQYPDRQSGCKGASAYVVRGASWQDIDPRITYSSTRLWNDAAVQISNCGFRCARSAP